MNEFENITQLAQNNNSEAQYKLALMHEIGVGTDKDLSLAFFWYEKSAAQNYAKAQYNLGIFFALGKHPKKDIKTAKYWIKKAHENGYSGGSIF
jgi:TPR repeat protein